MSRSGRTWRLTAGLAVLVATVLGAGLLAPSAARAVEDPPKVESADKVVKGKDWKVEPRRGDGINGQSSRVVWPRPAEAQVDVPATAKPVSVPKSPIKLRAPSGGSKDGVDEVTVKVLDRRSTLEAGIDGVAFLLSPADADNAGMVEPEVDYSGFAHAYGGDYGSRLRLVAYPECVLSTPDRAECVTPRPVTRAHNNTEEQLVSGRVEIGSSNSQDDGEVVLAATSGDSSEKGDYTATDLKASATWQVSEQTGDFSWQYPVRTPPVPGELTPDLKISYSSQSVDGRTSNTNNQPSWVGEGFEQWPGFIERRYRPCADDGAPQNNGVDPGDQCWAYDNATVTWNGKAGELIKKSDGTWRLKNDDGTRFEKLKDSGRANGDNSGEYWRVTTPDGTRFYFGFNRLPGWSAGKPETDSTWTVPVFGNNAGEPCHGDSFASSWCQQAWRWNLDYAVDPHGNAITYYYTQETNYYGRNVTKTADTNYVRGGSLKRIEYGLRSDALFATAPARVTFDTAERCIPTSSFDCDPAKIKDNPEKWPDVPWDMNCKSGDECALKGKISPTFWSRKRLTKITTQVVQSDGSGYRNVDSWSLDHKWGQADEDQALLLESIQHAGHAAGTVTLPKVTFNHLQLMNRLDKSGDDIAPFIKYRVGAIYDESGGQIDVNYSDEQCTLSDLPAPASNTKRCYPVYWTPQGWDDPKRDWFHKYVVDETIVSDRTGNSPDMITRYEYVGGAAWHYDDDDGLTKKKYKTWSQWRGYGTVQIRTGGFDDGMLTLTEKLFLRGMHGDRASAEGGSKDVSVPDGEGGTHTDHEAWAGHLLKETEYTKPGGTVAEKGVYTPWRHQTAERTRDWGTVSANLTGVKNERTWIALDDGNWRVTSTSTSFETTAGLPVEVDDRGDNSTAADNRCTRTSYATSTGAWMLDYPSREETVAVACDATPDRSKGVISDERSYFDGQGLGQAPTTGNITKTEKIASHDGTNARYMVDGTATFDAYGRKKTDTDAFGQTTTTTYTDSHGLAVKKTVTTPPVKPNDPATAHTIVEEYDPAWGLPTTKTNPGGKTTTLEYDGLGRLRKVFLPNATVTPNLEFTYQVAEGKIVAVGTKKITANNGQAKTTYALYDGMLRPRQTQELGQDGGRLIADTLYDSRGNKTTEYQSYYAEGDPQPTLFGAFVGDIETQIDYTHDGLNRPTVQRLMVGNNTPTEKLRTTTTYSGDRTSVTPPDGGTPTTTIKDARDQTTEIRHYKGDTPSGEYEATTYTYTPAGKLATVTDPAGNQWKYGYDLRGRKIKEEDPDKGTTTFTYDDLDRQVTSIDARGRTLHTSYDPLGRKTAVRDRGPTGLLRTSWTHDTIRKGLPTASTRHVGGDEYTSRVVMYDNLDRPTTQRVVLPESEGALGGSYTFGTTYNTDGTVRTSSHGAIGDLALDKVSHTYDDENLGRLLSTYGNDSGALVSQATWSHTGKLQQLQLGATVGKRVWISNEWEWGTRRLARNHVRRENQPRADRDAAYSYDDAGNITAISDASATGVDTQCFSYDFRRRLTQAWTQGTKDECASAPGNTVIGGPAPYWTSYDYDKSGNRTKEIQHGLGGDEDTTRTYTYPAAGAPQPHTLTKITETGPDGSSLDQFQYDETGNTTTRNLAGDEQNLSWDAEGHLEKVTDKDGRTTSFIYDASGERLLRKEPDATTVYLPDGTEAKLTHANGGISATRYYEFAGQTVAMRTGSGLTWLAGDQHGTDTLQINAVTQEVAQLRRDPFGIARGARPEAWKGQRGYVGGRDDPTTGLVHLGAREYDPLIGRFISIDPIMDLADPQQMQGYAYANFSPVTDADPSGLCSMTCLENNIGGSYIKDGKARKYPRSYQKRFGIGKYWNRPRPSYAHYRFVYKRPPIPPCGFACKVQRAMSIVGSFDGWAANWRDLGGGVIKSISELGCIAPGGAATCAQTGPLTDAYLGMHGVDQTSGWYNGGYWGTVAASALVGGGGAAVGALRATRQAYVSAARAIKSAGMARIAAGESPEVVARAAVAARSNLKLAARARTPKPFVRWAERRNMREYGNPLGPTYEWLANQGKTAERVIMGAGHTNKWINRILGVR